jgi:hypothetical protein
MTRYLLLSTIPTAVVVYAGQAWHGPGTHWRDLWIVLIFTILLAEGLGLISPEIDGPLSRWVWRLRDAGSGVFSLLLAFLGWMIWHFIKEGRKR